jgi:hypothetical protein
VALVLEKVDNIFSNEARNSFIIYNRQSGRTLQINVQPVSSDHKLLLISTFTNAADALGYVQRAREKAPTEIIPWLDKAKYRFIIITAENLPLVNSAEKLADYKAYIDEQYPGKF